MHPSDLFALVPTATPVPVTLRYFLGIFEVVETKSLPLRRL